jgi:hypothetical protein
MAALGCCASATSFSDEKFLNENTYATALTFVNLIQKRYYVIRRLEGAVDHLLLHYGFLCGQNRDDTPRGGESRARIYQNSLQSGRNCRDGKDKSWKNQGCDYRGSSPQEGLHRGCLHQGCLHQGCLHRGCSLERELSLVNSFWQDCLSYKRIMSDTHIRELLAHLIVLYDGLLKVNGKDSGLSTTRDTFSKRGLDELLDTVDVLSAISRSLFASKNFTLNALTVPLLFFPDMVDEPTVEKPAVDEPDGEILKVLDGTYSNDDFLVNTTLRFYLLQRIAVSMEQLSKSTSSKDVSLVCSQLPSIDSFKSQHIRECLQEIDAEGSLQPLLKLWESVGSYRYISDPYLIREMLLIVVQVYKVFMKVLVPHQEQAEAEADKVLDVFTTISSLPLPELFMLLDELTQQSLSIITSIHQGTKPEWKILFKQYWWLPPVVVAGCATLYLRIKHLLWHPQYRTA